MRIFIKHCFQNTGAKPIASQVELLPLLRDKLRHSLLLTIGLLRQILTIQESKRARRLPSLYSACNVVAAIYSTSSHFQTGKADRSLQLELLAGGAIPQNSVLYGSLSYCIKF